jgi:hypothetical protein
MVIRTVSISKQEPVNKKLEVLKIKAKFLNHMHEIQASLLDEGGGNGGMASLSSTLGSNLEEIEKILNNIKKKQNLHIAAQTGVFSPMNTLLSHMDKKQIPSDAASVTIIHEDPYKPEKIINFLHKRDKCLLDTLQDHASAHQWVWKNSQGALCAQQPQIYHLKTCPEFEMNPNNKISAEESLLLHIMDKSGQLIENLSIKAKDLDKFHKTDLGFYKHWDHIKVSHNNNPVVFMVKQPLLSFVDDNYAFSDETSFRIALGE